MADTSASEALQKVDPPGGTTGRVGFSTGVDEAPVLDANPRQKSFSSEVIFGFAWRKRIN
jgi:hypothetical protein